MPGCAGLITMHYKIAVTRHLVEERLPRVGDHDADSARQHMQRAVNAMVAPGAQASADHKHTASSAGYNEIPGVVGNPVHGMHEEEGMGILPHLKILGHGRAQEAARIVELARAYAVDCLKTEDAATIKHVGRVVAHLLRAAQEIIDS